MTTYADKKSRLFIGRPDFMKPERRRSESRLKTYPSSTDIRNWCDDVEDRRQHILELIVKNYDEAGSKLIPLGVLIDILLAMGGNADVAQIKNCLNQLWKFINDLNLQGDDVTKLKEMTNKMDSLCKSLVEPSGDGEESIRLKRGVIRARALGGDEKSQSSSDEEEKNKDECADNCLAYARHQKEKDEIDKLVADATPTIQTKMKSPGKMITRIKGMQPGYEVVEHPSSPTHLTIKMGPMLRPKGPKEVGSKGLLDVADNTKKETMPEEKDSKLFKGLDSNNDKLAACQALCNEQKQTINQLTLERNNLKKKLDACLRELDNFKTLQTVTNPALPISCQQEIEALEAEIRIMRSGNPSPEEEAFIIKKEIEILKRYCGKLKDVENENEKLKVKLNSRVTVEVNEEAEKITTLKDKLKDLDDLTRERDTLANKVHMLEKQLLQYQDLPDDWETLISRADMLQTVIEERDALTMKINGIRGMEDELQKYKTKAERVDELERELRSMSKGDRHSGIELKKTQSLAGKLEVDLQNVKSEKDAMQKRISSLIKELDSQKSKITEAEMLRLERDRLQIKLNELSDIQGHYDEMMNKMKIYDNIKAERDMYKEKYEEVLDMECKCEMLKAQVDEARAVSREKEHLVKQVEDLETCICEQEEEIKHLVVQVDSLSRSKNDTNTRLNSYKEEMANKDRKIAESKDQLNQSHGLASRIRELEKLLHRAEHMILQKDCHIKMLENELTCKTGSVNVGKKLNKRDMDLVEQMRIELEHAKAENRRLQEIANKMLAISGDDHVKKMLKQSEVAVKKVVQELGKQYKEWDHVKVQSPKGKFGAKRDCLCHSTGEGSSDDCEKLRVELEELQKEKQKLEFTVKQLQGDGVMKKLASSNRNVNN